jgi:hypothetical protein
MREESSEKGNNSTIQLSPSYNASPFDLMQDSESPRNSPMDMPARGGRGNCSSKRKQRSMGLNTRTALLSVLAAAPGALAQNCISLAGSTQCSAFSSASISTDSTLVGFLYVVAFAP